MLRVPDGAVAMDRTTDVGTTRRSVLVSLVADCMQLLMLGVGASLSGSVALRSQVAAAAVDVAVQVFLLVGVLSSARPSDDAHPLGYGRERFFWSFLAALGIFVGGGGFALDGAVRCRAASVSSRPLHDRLPGVGRDRGIGRGLPGELSCGLYVGTRAVVRSRCELSFSAARIPQRPRSSSVVAAA